MGYILETLGNLMHQTAFFNLTWGNYVMVAVACFFLFLAIKKDYEPLLLVPIAFGMLLVNIYPDIKGKFAAIEVKFSFEKMAESVRVLDNIDDDISLLTDFMIYQLNDCFYQTKNIIEFLDDSFVIVKSIESKNWHPAMAVKDSHKALNAVLLGKGDCR